VDNVKHVNAKHFLTPTGLGTGYACNPYVGCMHGCIYCYAKFVSDYQKREEPWGTFVDIKEYPNYDILRLNGDKSVIFSSVTDAYQPIEKTERRTRKILENIYESRLQVRFLTKSDLILRDLDLLTQMQSIEIGFSIALDDETAKIMEPNAALPSKRIAALKTIHAAKISTFVFIAPIFPKITDVFAIIAMVKDHCDYIMFDSLNLKHAENKANVFKFISTSYPELLPLYQNIFEKRDNSYYRNLAVLIREYANTFHLDLRIVFPESR